MCERASGFLCRDINSSCLFAFYFMIIFMTEHQVNEEGPVDCIIWKKSSTAYKKQADELDGTNVLMFMST